MKKQLDIKKLLILNLPYILMGLFATNFGEAWRMAQGADASQKALSLISVLPVALASWWPSLHPLDLLVGICCGGGLRLAVYLKSKNAKKYRHGMEYGSARWGTHEDIAPYTRGESESYSKVVPNGYKGRIVYYYTCTVYTFVNETAYVWPNTIPQLITYEYDDCYANGAPRNGYFGLQLIAR